MKRFSLILVMVTMCLASMAQNLVIKPSRLQHAAAKAVVNRAAATTDEHGIITAPPAGEERTYKRSGKMFVPFGFDMQIQDVSNETRMVFCEDGTVYMHHPLTHGLENCGLQAESWVKGVRADGLITFDPQPISWSNSRRAAVIFGLGDFDRATNDVTWIKGEPVVFREMGGGRVLSLVDTSEGSNMNLTRVMTGFVDISNYYSLGDEEFDTAFTLDTSGMAGDPVTVPAKAEKKAFVLTAYDDVLHQTVSYNAYLAFDGNDAYLGNFAFYARETWIKGERDADGNLTFASEQFLKRFDPNNLYFYALPQDLTTPDYCSLVLRYDAETGCYEAAEDVIISNDMISMPLDVRERLQSLILRPKQTSGDVIADRPEGMLTTYNRNGTAIELVGMGARWTKQEGKTVEIVTSYDGKKVYMLDPISTVESGMWVEGTIDEQGNYHFPLVQQIALLGDEENSYPAYTAVVRRISLGNNQYQYEYADDISEVVFIVDEDGWVEMAPVADDDVLADPPLYLYAMVDEVFEWQGYGDYGSVYEPVETIDLDDLIADPAPGEKYNGYGIITQPGTGKAYTYSRSGKNYAPNSDQAIAGDQSGALHLVECENGTVYMQQPLSTYSSSYAATSWIRGKRVGNKLYFKSGQPLSHQDYYDENVLFAVAKASASEGYVMDREAYAVFEESADRKTLTLITCKNDYTIVGAFSDDDDMWYGYGDYATVLTYTGEGLTEETVAPSWRAEKINYLLQADDFEEGHKGYNAVLAFEGDDVYLGNFCFWADYYHEINDKYVWIKGKKAADGTLTFPKEQYLYTFTEQGKGYDLFFYAAEETVANAYATRDLVLRYNAATDSYTSDLDILITFGRVATSMPRAEQLTNVRLTPLGDDTKPYVIKEQPEGILLKFSRSGVALGIEGMNIFIDKQQGEVEFVFSFDGRFVYMHKPIQEIGKSMDSWISGTVDDKGTLHFPVGQWLDWSDEFGYGVRTAACVLVGNATEGSYYVVPNIAQLTFSFDAKTGSYSMDQISGLDYDCYPPRLLHGAYWTNDNTWVGCGDGESVYSPLFTYDSIEAVTQQPANGETYYDFSGRRIQRPARGLYIQDGRKVMR